MESKTMPNTEQGHADVPKKVYAAPALVVYGKLIDLTAGGTINNNEHANLDSPQTHRPDTAP